MYDRRVIRGSTYAAQSLHSTGPELKPTKRTRSKPPRTPEPVEGRRHMDIQTEQYLEELVDTVPESDVTTQTDAFMDRPPTPLFVPMKIGIDVQTQIEDGDLFDFDFEVEPILEVLVGKTLEQGLMEVMEEEELAAMRAHQSTLSSFATQSCGTAAHGGCRDPQDGGKDAAHRTGERTGGKGEGNEGEGGCADVRTGLSQWPHGQRLRQALRLGFLLRSRAEGSGAGVYAVVHRRCCGRLLQRRRDQEMRTTSSQRP